MDQRTADAARLAREVRAWRAAICCLAVLAVPTVVALGRSGAPAPVAARPIAVLEVPRNPQLKIIGGRIERDLAPRRMVVSGGVSLAADGRKMAPQRVTLEP